MAAPTRRTKSHGNFLLRVAPFVLISVVSAFVVASQLRATPATTTGPDYYDLVLNLTFDSDSGSTVVDSSRYQHHGTATGTTIVPGKYGSGRVFNGSTDYIAIPHAAVLSPTDAITVEAWVYPDPSNPRGRIVQKRNMPEGGGYVLSTIFDNPLGHKFEIYHADIEEYASAGVAPTSGAWQHVVGTFDGSAVRIYVDGALKSTDSYSGRMTAASSNLIIGGVQSTFNLPFKGTIDEIRIYNRALSAEEVSCSYEGKVWVSGSCQSTAPNRPPVVVSMSGPTTMEANVQGTWTVKVYDPDGGRLVHSVDWGDGGAKATDSAQADGAGHLTTTFAHVYQTAGTFTSQVTVTDPSGASASLSAASITVAPPPDTQPPGLLTMLVAEETTPSSSRVAWLAPSDNVGVTTYEVRYRQGTSFADVDWSSATSTAAVPSTVAAGQRVSTVLSGLIANTDYGVGVKACDAAGNCSTIAAATFRTLSSGTTSGSGGTADIAPPSISSFSMGIATSTTLGIRWTVPQDNVGVTQALVRRKVGAMAMTEQDWATAEQIAVISSSGVVAGTEIPATLTGFAPGATYSIGIKACDAAGNCSGIAYADYTSPTSDNAVTGDSSPPGIPTSVTVSEITSSSARIAWVAPSDNVAVVLYVIRYREGPSFAETDWANALVTVSVPSTAAAGSRVSTVFSELLPSTSYAVAVKACDATSNCSGLAPVTFRTFATTTTTTGTTTTGTGTGSTSTSTGTSAGSGTSTTSGSGGTTTTTTTTTIGTATLRVTVRDAAAQPVSGAFVGLAFPGGGAASPTLTTGADGIAVFSNVAAGSYHLGVSPPTTRSDLGSIASQPVALALSATTDLAVSLPVRTATTDTTGGTTMSAAVLCGTVYDPDRNILSNITIGLSETGAASGRLGVSALTGADGRYCFANLAPGTYVIGATTPAHRTDLSPPGTVVTSLAAGTSGTQDLVFGRALVVATPGIPPSTPPPSAPAPLPIIERCVRDAFGLDLYERMRTGKYKPKTEEYERARHCFNLTVIADHRPIETPIGAPVIPMPSVIVIQGPAVPPPTVRPPEFDDRCEVRELPRVKRGLQRMVRSLTAMEREVDRLRTAKVVVPIDTGLFMSRARDLLASVQSAKTCEDAFTAGEELPEIMEQLRVSVERVSRLRFAPRVLSSFDREVRRFLDRTRSGVRRLDRAKFTVTGFQTRLGEAEQQLKDCRASATAALAAIDPELFEDTMRSCFEILSEGREIEELVGALANARAFLTGRITTTLQKATRVIRDLGRQKKDGSEVQQFAVVLRQQRDRALAGIRAGQLQRDELADALEDVIAAFGDLDDAFERALGTSTYDTVVGKPPASLITPKLEKPAEDFFDRE